MLGCGINKLPLPLLLGFISLANSYSCGNKNSDKRVNLYIYIFFFLFLYNFILFPFRLVLKLIEQFNILSLFYDKTEDSNDVNEDEDVILAASQSDTGIRGDVPGKDDQGKLKGKLMDGW